LRFFAYKGSFLSGLKELIVVVNDLPADLYILEDRPVLEQVREEIQMSQVDYPEVRFPTVHVMREADLAKFVEGREKK
jgi:hypothetical protein